MNYKKLNFANVKPSQVETFIEGNLAKRELVIDGISDNKKVIFQNYDDENVSPIENDNNNMQLNLNNNKISDDKKINLKKTRDIFFFISIIFS